MYLEESKQILRKAPLFRELTEPHLDLILTICEEAFYSAGQFIFRQDDPGDALYLIADGEVEILLESREAATSPSCWPRSRTARSSGKSSFWKQDDAPPAPEPGRIPIC